MILWKLWIFICLCDFVCTNSPNNRRRGFVNGDIVIGALFAIHEQPTMETIYKRECGEIREQYGMHRIEVLLKTINEINANPHILPGIKLGVDIRDTCWYPPIALEQSIDFIKNSIAQQEDLPMFDSANPRKAIAGLIGAASSTVTIQVQNLLQLFKIPQIGYASTSIDLSKKDEYKYFLRVVPSDKLQVKVLIDIVKYYRWSFISLVNTLGSYGTQGIKELVENLKSINSICTDQTFEIDDKEELQEFIKLAKILFSKDKPKVIICFCQGETVTKLLKAMNALNLTNQGYLLIGTDGWADRTDILGDLINKENGERILSNAALGSISIRLHSKPLSDFDKYFRSKTFRNTEGNPWFQEFWEHKFKCSINLTSSSKYNKTCLGTESLSNNVDYVQDSKLGFVVKSVMTMALGLHNIFKTLCSSNGTKCESILNVNGTNLLHEMLKLSFVAYDNETVRFDDKGDPPGRYDIMNYQTVINEETGQKIFKYQKVGTWKDDDLAMEKPLKWPKTLQDENSEVTSICSSPCKINEIRVPSCDASVIIEIFNLFKVFTKGKFCCWKCKSCGEMDIRNFSSYEEKCSTCPQGFLPNENKTECVEIQPTHIQWSDVTSIIAVVFSCVGILTTVFITVIFAKFNNTPVVKSSTRELMYVILAGISLAYITTFPLLCKPTVVTCTLTRILPGFSFSLIFGSLVTKTNRICRILAISKKKIIRRKGRFLTNIAQINIVLLLNIIELGIIGVMIWRQPPGSEKFYRSNRSTNLECNTSMQSLLIPLGFDAALVCFCTWYAFKTRNLPENFNEAKFIGFTMYTTCIIWVGLVVVYLGAEFKVISLCFATSLTATVAIVLLFMPKVYIIIFKPQKNERSAFTTTTEIRCHIGSGKVEYQCSKEKGLKSNSQLNLKYLTDNRKCSINKKNEDEFTSDHISLKTNFSHQAIDYGNERLGSGRETKLTQTEFSLIMELLFSLSGNLGVNNDELTVSQIALLQFLEENWNKEHILQFRGFSSRTKTDNLCEPETFVDEDQISRHLLDDTDVYIKSPKHTMLTQCNSVLTYSPISNVSTDASSTINTLFLDYLQLHGKQFRTVNDKKSVKL